MLHVDSKGRELSLQVSNGNAGESRTHPAVLSCAPGKVKKKHDLEAVICDVRKLVEVEKPK